MVHSHNRRTGLETMRQDVCENWSVTSLIRPMGVTTLSSMLAILAISLVASAATALRGLDEFQSLWNVMHTC